MANKESNGYGVASMVLGIISILFFYIPFLGLICGILGIIFYNQQKKAFTDGITTAGLITSIIGLILSIIAILFWIIFATILMAILGALMGTPI